MSFLSNYKFDELLPPYLSVAEKGRLQKGLEQFIKSTQKNSTPDYSNFFIDSTPDYLMQSDILNSIKMISWDTKEKDFKTGFIPAMLLSSTCDLSKENDHTINKKEALFAPIIAIHEYCDDLEKEGYKKDQINSFYNTLRKQEFSNLFYIPQNEKNGKDYMVFLDKVSWFPSSELLCDNISLDDLRYISLSNYGFYLFILKLSYHFCRLPEEADRAEISSQREIPSQNIKNYSILTRHFNKMKSNNILRWFSRNK